VASGSSLPDGLTLSIAGVLSGKPTAPGAASFSVTVTDSAQNTATAQFGASIKAGIAVATSALPGGFVGTFYSAQLTAMGGSGTGYAWSLAGQATVRTGAHRMTAGMPDGLTLSSDGWITGTPTASGIATATVMVTDSAGNSASAELALTIDGGITITTPSTLPGGHTGDPYSQMFAVIGGSGSGYSWVSADLPGGLRLSADGVLSGGLPAANTYTFHLTVTDSAENTATGTFTINVTNELRFATLPTLINTYAGLNYQATIRAKGGSGGYVFTLTSGSVLPTGLLLSSNGVLSGKPAASGTFGFNLTVTDSASNTAEGNFSLTVNPAVSISSPAALPAASVGMAYSQNLTVTGGSGSGYMWTLTSGSASLSAVGLSFANGAVSGTPTTTGTATFSVSVTDSSLTYGTGTFTVRIHQPGQGFQVSGQISLVNACGATSVPPVTFTIDTNPAQTATSDSSGNYSFASVPDGSYTITPSITGANSMFYPGSIPVTMNGAAVSGQNFAASLAYKVSGTVTYTGSEMGQVYVWLFNKHCGGNPLGASMTAPGSFTIEGVAPGVYTLAASIDALQFGYLNDADATGVAVSDVTITDADVTGTAITMTDPVQNALPAGGPIVNAITGSADGVVLKFQPIIGPSPIFSQIELPSSYDVQWSTDPGFGTLNGNQSFSAGASNGTSIVILSQPTLASGGTYYFRMRAVNSAGNGDWTIYSTDGVNPAGVMVAAPAGNLVTGTVTFGAPPTGPLYVGYYDTQTGNVYSTRIQNPVSPQAYSVNVATGQSYFHFAVLDQNDDGTVDPGDVSNTRLGNIAPVAVTGDMTGQDLTLSSSASKATVSTEHIHSTNDDGSVKETYSLNFQIQQGNKLPVAVRLLSGPHILHPVDLGKCADCGNNQFRYDVSSAAERPAKGESYQLLVTYNDSSSETLTARITGVLDAFATNLTPSIASSSSLAPTFSWTNPDDPENYYYQFLLTDNAGNVLWTVWGPNAYCPQLCYTINSLTWGVDVADANNKPAVNALTPGVEYHWLIQVFDSNGNSTMQRTYFKP
jgi:hypothetical protein